MDGGVQCTQVMIRRVGIRRDRSINSRVLRKSPNIKIKEIYDKRRRSGHHTVH